MSDTPSTPQPLGEAWKQARKNAGLSQEAMAARLGISDSYLSLIENNRRQPQISHLKRIAEIMKQSMESLCPEPDTILADEDAPDDDIE